MELTVLVAQAAAVLWLAGMVWTVQVVHYPLFARVGDDAFTAYEAAHTARMGGLVTLPWAVQGLTTAWVLVAPPAGVGGVLAVLGAVLAATTVAVTVAVSVPQHRTLADGFDPAAWRRLTTTNWLRTAAWTGHAVVALVMLVAHLRTTG